MPITDLSPLQIAGFAFEIVDDTLALARQELAGSTDMTRGTIRISTDSHDAYQLQTLLHETCHAIQFTYLEGFTVDHHIIAAMSQGIFQLLRDNPKLMDAISALDQEVCNGEMHSV